MAFTKHIFKLLILVQFLACTFATYGHPDAEVIDFGSPTQQSRDQMIIEAAIKRGMDGEAVAELLRTRTPVVRTTVTPSGFTKTTTYKLEPDGSISSSSILKKRNRYVYNSGSIPDELKNSPTGTVTRTYTDSDGSKVTQTIAVNRDNSMATADHDGSSGDWLSQPFGSWPQDTLASPHFTTNHRTITRTYSSPNGERRTVQSWSSEPETPNWPKFHRTNTQTFTRPNADKPVMQDMNHKSEFPPIEDTNWPNFDDPTFPSWDVMESSESDTPNAPKFHRTNTQAFTRPKADKPSTKPDTFDFDHNFHRTNTQTYTRPNADKPVLQTTSTKPDTFDINHKSKFPSIEDVNWPNFDDPTILSPWDAKPSTDDDDDGWEVIDAPETATKKAFKSGIPKTWEWPEFFKHPTTTTTTPTAPALASTTYKSLPSLDEFLKNQYGTTAKAQPTTSTSKTSTYTPKFEATTTPKSSSTTTKFIKIEDLPVVEVLHNGKPADESILRTLPAHLTPRTPSETVLNIEHKHPIEDNFDSYTPKLETNIRSYSKTLVGPEKPRLKDLDPQMQDILNNAGIVPEIEGDTVTKTRTEPDGRVITTTYKVSTMPSIPIPYSPPRQDTMPSRLPHLSPITEFLARLGLSRFDLTAQNGRYSRTIIDENGDVLTATFVLTSANHKAPGKK